MRLGGRPQRLVFTLINIDIKRTTLARWGKFNLVGAIGICVQLAVLLLLKRTLRLDVLLATTVAVETAVLHNFVWHERFTWADRIVRGTDAIRLVTEPIPNRRWPCPHFFRRLWRFHLANGAVSIAGNLAIMKLLVEMAHLNYLAANAIAIALCALANFLLSDRWVFES